MLELLEAGDNVMVDRGFDIAGIVPNGVAVNMPPFLAGREQMTAAETEEAMSIASVWIHVERAIGRIIEYCPAAASHQVNVTLSSCGAAKTQQGFILNKSSIASNRNSQCKFMLKGSDLSQCYAHCTVPAYMHMFLFKRASGYFLNQFCQ